jgi:phenylacetate-CoA ligase
MTIGDDMLSVKNKFLVYAYQYVPYYTKLFDEHCIDPSEILTVDDFNQIPILLKSTIQQYPEAFISTKYATRQLKEIRTTGSTGIPLSIYWDEGERIRSLLDLWQMRSTIYGVSPSNKFCTFHNIVSRENYINKNTRILRPNARSMSFSLLNLRSEHLAEYYTSMREFAPSWILGSPSVVYLLARYISDRKLDPLPSLTYIELTGEYVFISYKKKIEEVFQVPVVNMYGSMEANGIAMECKNSNLHCMEHNIVEIVKNGRRLDFGEEGEVCLTIPMNKAMVFIRYLLGDKGVMFPYGICNCGNHNPVLKILAGRTKDYVTLPNGELESSIIFSTAVEHINFKHGNPIIQFQVIQEDVARFTCLFTTSDTLDISQNTLTKSFIEEMDLFGMKDVNWEFHFHERIFPNPETGKLAYFINKIRGYQQQTEGDY